MALILLLPTGQVIYASTKQNVTSGKNTLTTNNEISVTSAKKPSIDHLDGLNQNNPLGYNASPIKESVSKFEKAYNKNVKLPQYIPFTPTHSGGKFAETPKIVTVDYLNKETNERLCMMVFLRPEQSIEEGKTGKYVDCKAVYDHLKESKNEFMSFKEGDLLYYITISKNNRDEKLDDLLKVANSLK